MAVGKGERVFLYGAWAVIATLAAFGLLRGLLPRPDPLALPDPPPEAARHHPEATTPSEPLVDVGVTGRVVDRPGLPVDPTVLMETRLSLVTSAGEIRATTTPAVDGAFQLGARVPLRGLRLRLRTELRTPGADVPLHFERELRGPHTDVGEIALPRSEVLGGVMGTIVDGSGAPLVPDAVELVSLGALSPPPDLSLNVPTLYRQGHRFAFLRVPPGRYRLRARADGRRLPPMDLAISVHDRTVTVAESRSLRRLLGSVRHASTREPLGDVEIFLDAAGDPAWVQGRTSRLGHYDLPLPDPMPADGVTAVYSRRGFRGTTVRVAAGDLGAEGVLRLHVELPPEQGD